MRAIKVEYQVKPGYAETNKANIRKVMEELHALGDVGVLYSTYVKEDGVSFVHFAIYRTEENILPTLASFKDFNAQLKAEGLFTDPQAVKLNMVGKSFDF